MFTGLIETLGIVISCAALPKRKTLLFKIQAPRLSGSLKAGHSLCVNGVCLTVIKRSGKNLSFHVVGETKKRSNLSYLKEGDAVNLERPLRFKGRVEGHFVLGHVDATGVVRQVINLGKEKSFLIAFPGSLSPAMVEKGSIAVDGVSMTLGRVGRGHFWLHCIPHTLKCTNFKSYRRGTRVNLETDILAKWAARQKPKAH